MDSNLSIFKKGLLLVSIPLLAQLIFLGVLAMVRSDQAEAQKWAVHTKEVIAQAEATRRLAVDAHSQVRGFMLTRRAEFAKAYESDRASLQQSFATLTSLVADNAQQVGRVEGMRAQAEFLLEWLNHNVEVIRQGAAQPIAERAKSGEGQRRIDKLNELTVEFLASEHHLGNQRDEQLEDVMLRQHLILLGGIVLALASTTVMLWAFGRGIGHRLRELTANMRRFGVDQELAPERPGRDEIAQLDRAFHDMATSLVQKNRENEMFVYSVSHDLRSPLVNLQGFSQELANACGQMRGLLTGSESPVKVRDTCVKLLDREAAESLHFIQTAVGRLGAIIDALLRLSREGRVAYHKQVVDVKGTVGRVVDSLRDFISRRGVEVRVEDMPPAWADPTALDQIFANLIGNAVNYLDPQRPGKIEIGRASNRPAEVPPDWTVYYVKDNGLGIPGPAREKIFLAFQRLHPQAAPGEGVGLALVHRAVERHGGKIWLTSNVGEGTTVFVALPPQPVT